MDQEKIGKFIKEIRLKENMSQQKFAQKYGVTYQAVSKWENGKNIPDLSILKAMCEEYDMNLDDFLTTKINKKKNVWVPLLISLALIVASGAVVFVCFRHKPSGFEFKTLSTTCDNFNLFGSVAYNSRKSSIYISNITYCGGDDERVYSKIECTLYESEGSIERTISNYDYDGKEPITLEEFLKAVEFKIDNYEQTCKAYEDGVLHLEIDASGEEGVTTYKIPLSTKEECKS